ncbi:hypothetical protein CEXT_330061 [Caerostris extrusa]|uniref:Ycf15 n=1 Tax=Caerostris extrusa TaxID=172846 RepID=A0AAV4MKH9_CAEEX|nr:hypothetical protein CEXT_330061 [Caerostris extrusa]
MEEIPFPRISISHWERNRNFLIQPLIPGRSIAFFPLPELISSERVLKGDHFNTEELSQTETEHFRSLSENSETDGGIESAVSANLCRL